MSGALRIGWVTVLAIGCAKAVEPAAVSMGPIHPELSCPAGTFAAGLAPPRGHEAWCEQRNPGPPMRQGPSLTWHDNGQKASQGQWASDLQTGPWLYWHPNGEASEQGQYVAGVKEGVWTTWASSGARTSEGPFVGGVPDGAWTFWDPTAQTRTEGRYVLGERQGLWITFGPDGPALSERDYRGGRLINTRVLR